jgi:hypothetical protein
MRQPICLRQYHHHPTRNQSFDNLVGAGEDRLRHGKAERLGGPEIDDQLEFGRLRDRQISGLGNP